MDYLHTRDSSRATLAAGTSVPLAAKAWQLSQREIAQRGGKVRHLWDLRWHGANQAICNPVSRTSWVYALYVARIPRGPRRTLARAFQRLLFYEPGITNRGQLWTGLWSPQHRTALGPALQLCSLKEGQRKLLDLATWAAAGGPTDMDALHGTSRSTGTPPLSRPQGTPPARGPAPRPWAPENAPTHAGHSTTPVPQPSLDGPRGRGPRMRPSHQPPCPGGRLLSNPRACRNARQGGHCLCRCPAFYMPCLYAAYVCLLLRTINLKLGFHNIKQKIKIKNKKTS